MTGQVVLAIDAGQSGTRARLVRGTTVRTASAGGVGLVVDADTLHRTAKVFTGLCGTLLRDVDDAAVDTVVVGTTGLSRHRDQNAELAAILLARTSARRVVLAHDGLTAHLGALGGRPGVVAAVGTGVVVFARTSTGRWLPPLDGHGSALGDRGGGYHLGLVGLREAARQHDLGELAAPLLDAGRRRFGPVVAWSGAIVEDGTARIAAFARDVLRLAAGGDPTAIQISALAAGELARTVCAAVCALRSAGDEPMETVDVSWSGSVLTDPSYRTLVTARIKELCTDVTVRAPEGSGLDGAIILSTIAELAPAPGLVEVYGP
ncbi:BadF/BadG/BcrA/BcrD ATPase family protein [Actinopolymorpha sp. B11F2]|uniref:BadF/BadG/BcrA/BcrD ATPase family protein n=1 Tax=Actinopolymorpha sp. B11F2 TaxID=3160862 RepID=UPI0032E40CAD